MFEKENVKSWIPFEKIETSALEQINNISKHPKLGGHIAIMPDVHAGKGCVIGSVFPLYGAVCPAAVGVDIGCGVAALKTDINADNVVPYFDEIHEFILNNIPLGHNHRSENQTKKLKIDRDYKELISAYQKFYKDDTIMRQLGTLGGGNHFIELQEDNNGYLWIMVHSGSRNIGHKIASKYINIAKEQCSVIEVPADLEYLDSRYITLDTYMREMKFAVDFAYRNRQFMIGIIFSKLMDIFLQEQDRYADGIDIPHNYVFIENINGKDVFVHRKGVTYLGGGTKGIVLGSMGSFSYIVTGKNNKDAYLSCSHGAIRAMSRNVARVKIDRKTGEVKSQGKLSVSDFAEDMKNIYTKNVDINHLDEATRAYKNIDDVMEYQKDLVNIIEVLKPIFNVKG